MALGARTADIRRCALREVLPLAGVGAALGLAAALAVGRVLAGRVAGVSAADPLILSASSAAMLGVAALAAWLPTRRAARLDPAAALRME